MRRGFTIVELLIVMGIIVLVGLGITVNLAGRKSTVELTLTTQRIAALLRQAQSRSMSQVSSTSWSIHLDNGSTPFYALYAGGTYSTGSQDSRFALPTTLRFATTSVAQGNTADVFFAQLSGGASGSTSITLYMLNNSNSSSTISIDPSGSVSY